MGDPHTVPAVSDKELADFWAGESAFAAATPYKSEPCCTRCDVPGVGLVHAFDCRDGRGKTNQSGRAYQPGEVPPALTAHVAALEAHREKLLLQLLFAAGNLAAASVDRAEFVIDDGVVLNVRACRYCRRSGVDSRPIEHQETCSVLRVERLIDRICAPDVPQESIKANLNRKEPALEELSVRGAEPAPRLNENKTAKGGAR